MGAGVGAGMCASAGGVRPGVVAGRGVMGVGDAVTGQGVVRVTGVVARQTGAGGAVAGSALLVSAKLTIILNVPFKV